MSTKHKSLVLLLLLFSVCVFPAAGVPSWSPSPTIPLNYTEIEGTSKSSIVCVGGDFQFNVTNGFYAPETVTLVNSSITITLEPYGDQSDSVTFDVIAPKTLGLSCYQFNLTIGGASALYNYTVLIVPTGAEFIEPSQSLAFEVFTIVGTAAFCLMTGAIIGMAQGRKTKEKENP